MFRSNTLRTLVRGATATVSAKGQQVISNPMPSLYQQLATRTQTTHVSSRTNANRLDTVIPPPETVSAFAQPSKLPLSKSVPESGCQQCDRCEQTEAAEIEWRPQCILHQPHPTEEQPWDPSDILSSRFTVTPEYKVQHSKPGAPSILSPPASGTFRYTLDPATLPKLRPNQLELTTEQRAFYEENGYIVIKKLVKDHDLERYAQRFRDYANGKFKTPAGMVVQKEVTKKGEKLSEYTLYKLQELYTDDVLFDYCKDPNILDYVQQFTGQNILSIHSMFINKPPIDSTSSRHPLHQEIHYFPIRPEDRIVCTWMPLEPTTRENGCLVVVPKSHRFAHLEHDYPDWEGGVNKFYYGIKDASLAEQRMHVEMEAGDCLFFHPLTIHGSGMNRSKGFRKAFSCHFAAAECDFIPVNGTIQEKLANEILSIYVDKLSEDTVDQKLKQQKIDYPTMWKLRSKLVRGEGPFKRA